MRFSPHLLDEIRARLPVSQVVGRKVSLKRKGREYSGLSPFKMEKTPSFFVNDQKGFYHCFASGEHGDIFKFLMTTEGLSFPEAVEKLAEEAGVPLPKVEAEDREREDQRTRLLALMEESAKFFEAALHGASGAEARRYIEKRGLKRETLATFRVGYSPNSRHALKDHLAKAGYTLEEMSLSGMLISGDDIPVAYDRFRHRVMFPIGDAKGRIVAFGGRALDPEQNAKYLNSPETPLFHKGHLLFNAHRARPAAHDKERVLAVEGYMDVISLAEAGFTEAVAPLGTALTEDQLNLLWRMSAEPILCFDGDGAGKRAAFRAVDTALPHLKPGASLMFAFLPDGLDPDDLVRQQGPAALDACLGRSRPLIDVLFEREWSQGDWSTPERRAGLEKTLKGLIARIEDESVRAHYRHALKQRLDAAWGLSESSWRGQSGNGGEGSRSGSKDGRSGSPSGAWQRAGSSQNGRFGAPSGARRGLPQKKFPPSLGHGSEHVNASSSLRKSSLVAAETSLPPQREALLIKVILNHPWLIDEQAEAIAELPFTSGALSRLRDAILSAHALDNSLDTETLRTHLNKSSDGKTLTLVERAVSHKCDRFAEPDAGRTEVEDGWRHALAMHERHVGLQRSLEAAEQAWLEDRSEVSFARICDLKQQLELLSSTNAFDIAAEFGHSS
ncbi:DNA primase [Hyphomicrobium sp. LHD-15]|uniref:DNA primase n=1 Tax=Hyphomicrobium sp. LHD-15 TaxID=3072142 RepID=UPI00280E49F2|nr:DNA primase [Hyphomicrobium sp. LHD-15]MDQ8700293.1 DNA primase [Hyphomicrobium sp. LHD-15]